MGNPLGVKGLTFSLLVYASNLMFRRFSREWNLDNLKILRAGIIAKYYVQVMLLFVYNGSREISGNEQMTYLFTITVEKTQASTIVTIFLRQ